MSVAESLKHVMLFAGLEDAAREAIAHLAVERTVPAGQTLFREGQPAEGFYVVLDGDNNNLGRISESVGPAGLDALVRIAQDSASG